MSDSKTIKRPSTEGLNNQDGKELSHEAVHEGINNEGEHPFGFEEQTLTISETQELTSATRTEGSGDFKKSPSDELGLGIHFERNAPNFPPLPALPPVNEVCRSFNSSNSTPDSSKNETSLLASTDAKSHIMKSDVSQEIDLELDDTPLFSRFFSQEFGEESQSPRFEDSSVSLRKVNSQRPERKISDSSDKESTYSQVSHGADEEVMLSPKPKGRLYHGVHTNSKDKPIRGKYDERRDVVYKSAVRGMLTTLKKDFKSFTDKEKLSSRLDWREGLRERVEAFGENLFNEHKWAKLIFGDTPEGRRYFKEIVGAFVGGQISLSDKGTDGRKASELLKKMPKSTICINSFKKLFEIKSIQLFFEFLLDSMIYYKIFQDENKKRIKTRYLQAAESIANFSITPELMS